MFANPALTAVTGPVEPPLPTAEFFDVVEVQRDDGEFCELALM